MLGAQAEDGAVERRPGDGHPVISDNTSQLSTAIHAPLTVLALPLHAPYATGWQSGLATVCSNRLALLSLRPVAAEVAHGQRPLEADSIQNLHQE